MNCISLLREDHAGQSHAGIPQISQRAASPQTEQSQNKNHREELQPHFVNGVAPVENKPGRYCHGQRSDSADVFSYKWLKLQREPHTRDAHKYDWQPYRPQIPAKQTLREQKNVKVKRPVII